MNKKLKAFKICLPICIVLLIALVLTFFLSAQYVSDGTLEKGLQVVFTVIVSIFPIIVLIPICVALGIIEICLCVKENPKGSLIASLVFLSLLIPVFIFYVYMTLSILYELIYVVLLTIVTTILFIVTWILSCILVGNVSKKL